MTHNAGSKFDSFSRFRLGGRKEKKIGWTGNNLRQWPSSASWPPPSWHNPTDDDRVSFKGDPADAALWWSSTVGRLRYVLVRKLFNILVQSCVVIFHMNQRRPKFRLFFYLLLAGANLKGATAAADLTTSIVQVSNGQYGGGPFPSGTNKRPRQQQQQQPGTRKSRTISASSSPLLRTHTHTHTHT